MFKVMIVDDEIYVVALIRKLISWEKFQMQVEATANDGGTALTLMKEIRPDLVIVDIRMPEYDGIEFMDKVREFNHNVRFIVVSGHRQFDYAKGAMRNNVEDYLLKPINKEELETAIRGVHEKLIQDQRNVHKIKEMEEELDTSKKKLRRLAVELIMKQEYGEFDADLDKINRHYLTAFKDGFAYRLLALHLDISASSELNRDMDLMLKESGKKLREELEAVCEDVLDCEQENRIIFLIHYDGTNWGRIKQSIQKQMADCSRMAKKFENLFFRICISAECDSFDEIEKSRQSLWQCMLSRTVMTEGKLIEEKDIRKSDAFLSAVMEYREERFEQALPTLNIEEISRCIREMYSKGFYGTEEDSLLYYKLYMKLADKIWQYFSRIGICEKDEKEYKTQLAQLYVQAPGAVEYPRILCREIEQMINENQLAVQTQGVPSIRIVKRYIREHYQEDISLSMLAELVNISPVYLSRLFKKEEGINFLDYLNQYRIEVSKKLLQDIHCNIIEVAGLSGFHNTKYFSKMFKKAVGITPSEYRKRHLGKSSL